MLEKIANIYGEGVRVMGGGASDTNELTRHNMFKQGDKHKPKMTRRLCVKRLVHREALLLICV